MHAWGRAEDFVRFPTAGATGVSEHSNMDAGTELRSSETAASSIKYQKVSPDPSFPPVISYLASRSETVSFYLV